MIFALVKDFTDVLDAMPEEHTHRPILKLFSEAARRDTHFITRRPPTPAHCRSVAGRASTMTSTRIFSA